MSLISKFDPWRSKLCTCPFKLTLNPYTGCDHACIYCYASAYIPRFLNCRPKKNLIRRLRREAVRLKGEILSLSNSSDPYPNLEAEAGLTRSCLEVLSQSNCKIQIITKSPLVARDADLLWNVPSMVSLTVTTDDDSIAELIEPEAPLPSERLKAIKILVAKGIATSVRIDPVIPFLNEGQERLVKTLAFMGVRHVTSSTYKVKLDNWQRLSATIPEIAEKLWSLYFEKGEKKGGYLYLPKSMRLELMRHVASSAKKYGLKFGTCREDLACLNTATCDGSWLLNERFSKLF